MATYELQDGLRSIMVSISNMEKGLNEIKKKENNRPTTLIWRVYENTGPGKGLLKFGNEYYIAKKNKKYHVPRTFIQDTDSKGARTKFLTKKIALDFYCEALAKKTSVPFRAFQNGAIKKKIASLRGSKNKTRRRKKKGKKT